MNTEVDRAAALLFPEHGRHAIDVKFFFQPGATVEALGRQIIVGFEAMHDESLAITDVDAAA